MAQLDDYLETCEFAARAAGDELLRWRGRFSVQKKGPSDLVTQADFAAQEAVRKVVAERFPDHALLGEEGAAASASGNASSLRWIVDPLDGTTNYVHGLPHFAVSVALEDAGELQVGVVWDPMRRECFSAARGKGAWLNGEPIRTSRVPSLGDALVMCGFPAQVRPDSPDLKAYLAAIYVCQSLRRTGSAALNLCYVACGRADCFWSYSTKVWDIAAGALLLQEAGGKICNPAGGPFHLHSGQFLAAANAPLLDELRELMRAAGN